MLEVSFVTLQTASAFARTLKCHALFIEDLLAEGYDFIMISRFQSDPLEAIRSISTDEWWKVFSRTERSNIIRKDNQAQNTFEG